MEGVISKSFRDKILFDSFPICIEEGEIIWLQGASGSGKTTLLRILSGLESVDNGDVSDFILKKCGFVFQEPRLIEHYDALENLLLVTKDEDKAGALLSELDLPLDGKPVSKFSGGMKARVSILRALLSDSELLLFDEPFNGLDKSMKEKVIELIKRERGGRTLIIATHIDQDMQFFPLKRIIKIDQ